MLPLKALLKANNISQAELARNVGIAASTMSQLLSKGVWPVDPSPETLQSLITKALQDRGIAVDAAVLTKSTAVDAAATVTEEVINMLLRKQSITQAARKHFELFKDPFDNDVQDAEDVFLTNDIRYVREHLWTTAKLGGFTAVVGESGSGKSTLRRDLIDRISREDAPMIIIEPYVLGMEDNDAKGKTLKAASISDAIINTLAPLESPKRTMEAKSRQVHRLLRDSRKAGFSHCLVIEEAHSLPVATLKHLKRFFELEDGFKKLLSIILIGQTELKTKLSERSPEVREVVQRCELVELAPLDSHLEAYLKFKFERVGKKLEEVFDKTALDGIRERLIFSKASKGSRETMSLMYPLMVNNLVASAMNQAEALGFEQLTAELIKEA
jgi:type II secretory pathway predicted ATPase ExeA